MLAARARLLALAVAVLGSTLAGEAQALEHWKHPFAHGGAAPFHAAPAGPVAGALPAGAADPAREPVGSIPPLPRGPAEFQRPPTGAVAPGNAQRPPPARQFEHQALAARSSAPSPGRFWHGPSAGRFQARPFAGAIARRPMIGQPGFTGVPPTGETRFLANEMVLHVGSDVSPQTVDATARRLGVTPIASQGFGLAGGTLFRFRITDGRPVADVIRAFEAEHVGTAQPNYVFKTQVDTARPSGAGQNEPSQYVVQKLRLNDVHRIALGNTLVAVIDTEIDAKHPELAGAVVAEFDAIGNRDQPHTHGTGMAGAIAAHSRLVGIAPGARLLAVHAFSSSATDSAQATSEHILMGIDWAIRKGARIINMSFAGPDDPMLELALRKAREKGIVLVAAAGNMGPDSPPLYPAADPNVIAVTATDVNDKLLPQANQGSYIALAAPGVDVLEPAPNGGYQLTSGTSVAAAHVSGIAALLLDHQPSLSADTIRDALTLSARDPGHQGRNDQLGWGIVDPYRALMAIDIKLAARPLRERPVAPAPTAAQAGPISAR
jgi:hypothetical protein